LESSLTRRSEFCFRGQTGNRADIAKRPSLTPTGQSAANFAVLHNDPYDVALRSLRHREGSVRRRIRNDDDFNALMGNIRKEMLQVTDQHTAIDYRTWPMYTFARSTR
jgi:hypothetical protein